MLKHKTLSFAKGERNTYQNLFLFFRWFSENKRNSFGENIKIEIYSHYDEGFFKSAKIQCFSASAIVIISLRTAGLQPHPMSYVNWAFHHLLTLAASVYAAWVTGQEVDIFRATTATVDIFPIAVLEEFVTSISSDWVDVKPETELKPHEWLMSL